MGEEPTLSWVPWCKPVLGGFVLLWRNSSKVRWLEGEKGQFRHNNGSKRTTGNEILQNEMTGTQANFPPILLVNWISSPSFLFPQRLHYCYIYFNLTALTSITATIYIFTCSYLYNYYNYSWTLCIKCWVTAFHSDIEWNFLTLRISLKKAVFFFSIKKTVKTVKTSTKNCLT